MSESQTPPPNRAWEVFLAFLVQGFTAFGGPVAHVGFFRRAFVERRAWLSEEAFADLLAMSQFLPGPASSELGMAIGMRRAGYPGLIAAWLGFTLPAGATMIALAYLTPQYPNAFGIGVLHGLQVAAAAVVIQAVVAMARTLAVGPIKAGMAIGAAAGLVVAHGPLAQVVTLAAGAVIGLVLLREPAPGAADDPVSQALPSTPAIVALCLFAVLLGLLPFLAALTQDPTISLASVIYRTGALVFGGGHAVLPLLQNEVVNRGWIGQEQFLAGYGAVQAIPGPLFSFAGFVGAEIGGWPSGLVALAAIFLPGLLLVAGVLPFWDRLKGQPAARAAVGGVNAVVVGVLAAALWSPMLTQTVRRPSDWALVGAAYVFLAVARLPPWLVVAGFALASGLFPR
jgi:chromate transporter